MQGKDNEQTAGRHRSDAVAKRDEAYTPRHGRGIASRIERSKPRG